MRSVEFDFRPQEIIPAVLEFGAKKKKDKGKAKAWNQQKSGTSKARQGFKSASERKAIHHKNVI